ncbi:MAG TPA: hypothetical protein VF476_03265 [Chitinophagaceae bacterium]
MLRIKILNRKYHPYAGKVKMYGISLERILIISFVSIILLVGAVYIGQTYKKKKELHNNHDKDSRRIPA